MDNFDFFIQKEGQEPIGIQENYANIKYKQCKGLETVGKPKNKYTESYADADELRVYEPETVLRESTDITLTLVFVGRERKAAYRQFLDLVSSGKFYYWDTVRMKKAYLTLLESVEPSEDDYKGSTQYMLADFKFKNLWGYCKNV